MARHLRFSGRSVNRPRRALVCKGAVRSAFIAEVLEPRRLFAAGFLDSSFGTNGIVSLQIGAKTNDAIDGVGTSSGQQIVVGDAVTGSAQSGFITRLNADGSTDTTFGINGVTTFRFLSTNTVPTGIAIDPGTGDYIVCGVIGSGLSGQAFIAKYDTTGNLVPSFATDGFETFAPGDASAEASKVFVAASGEIAVGGTSLSNSGIGIMLALFNADGSPFTFLGGTGMNVFEPAAGHAAVGTDIVQDQAHWIVSGFDANLATGQMTFEVVAFNVDASVATSFGNSGAATASFGNHNEAALSVVADPTTHDIYAGGATANGGIALVPGLPAEGDKGHATFGDFAIASFTDTGALNAAFNGTGMQTVAIPAGKLAGASGMIEQSDGKLVLVGSAETGAHTADIASARINPDGSVDSSYADNGTSSANVGGSAGAFGAWAYEPFPDNLLPEPAVGGHEKSSANSGSAVIGALTNDSSSETSNPGPTPTLAPTVAAKFPVAALSGNKAAGFSASVKIANSGSGAAAGPAALNVYFSSTPTLDTSTATLAETLNLNLKLAPGKTLNVPIHLKTFPMGLSGSYYLLAQVSGGGASTAEGASTSTGNIAPAFFNLVNQSVTASPTAVVRGKTKLKISTIVQNAGNVKDTGPLAVQIAMATDPSGTSLTVIDTISVPLNLVPGKNKTIRISAVMPTSLPANAYYAAVTIDPQNTFNETSIADNTVVDLTIITAT